MTGGDESTAEERAAPGSASMDTEPATFNRAEPSIPPSAETLDSTESTPPTATPASSTPEPPGESNPAIQALLLERAARLDAERTAREEAERIARAEKAAGKKRAVETEVEASGSSAVRQAQMSYAAQQRLRKIEEKKEFNRILATIEADKKERRVREEERRLRVAAEAAEADGVVRRVVAEGGSAHQAKNEQPIPDASRASDKHTHCHLQILLFDGTRLRHAFPRHSTLRADVRPWIDASLVSDPTIPKLPPYTFKHIVPAQPARPISIGEEDEPLAFIGLMPNATLVLVPVQTFTEAYTGAGDAGALGSVFYGIRWVVGGVGSSVGALAGAVAGLVPGGRQATQPQLRQPVQAETEGAGESGSAAAPMAGGKDGGEGKDVGGSAG